MTEITQHITELQIPEENEEAIIFAKKRMADGFLALGKALKECKEKEYYKHFGYDNFNNYIESDRIAISRSHAYRCIAVAEYVNKYALNEEDVAAVGVGKMEMLPALKEKKPEVGLEDLQKMSWSAVVKDYKEARHESRSKINTNEIEKWQPGWKFPMSFRQVFIEAREKFLAKDQTGDPISDEYFIELIIANFLAEV